MTHDPEYISGVTTHTRRGSIRNRFSYGVDFVLIDPEAQGATPKLFSRNRFNLVSVHDRDHGGPLKAGRGPIWAREALANHGLSDPRVKLLLLTQPRFLGYGFNPVSFWLAMLDDGLVAVIAEVSTPFGDRHSYLCHQKNFTPITGETRITKRFRHLMHQRRDRGPVHFNIWGNRVCFKWHVARHRRDDTDLHSRRTRQRETQLVVSPRVPSGGMKEG
jgi:DUF1365 family protein